MATDEECRALLEKDNARPTTKPPAKRSGKHNMAKGALRPEDAAVSLGSSLGHDRELINLFRR